MKLSSHISDIKAYYDTVIIGSGYGGSIAAARFAEKGYSVCILEKGKEYSKGDFPRSLREFSLNIHLNRDIPFQKKTGLFDFKNYEDLDVLTGSGLGGGSLINAGVIERPTTEVMQSSEWPQEIRDSSDGLGSFYELSRTVLEAQFYPENREGYALLKKYKTFKSLAEAESIESKKVQLTVNFGTETRNTHGTEQGQCTGCGNCFTGCNYNAKNSLDKNYLSSAKNFGAEIFTEIFVSHIQYLESDKLYLIYCKEISSEKGSIKDNSFRILKAKNAVISAGAIGTVEILLRSKERNTLQIPETVGKYFSGNGGFISGGISVDFDVNQIGVKKGQYAERRVRDEDRRKSTPRSKERRNNINNYIINSFYKEQIGPTITAMLDKRSGSDRNGMGHVIEDSSIPGAIADTIPVYWYAAVLKNFFAGEISLEDLENIIEKNSMLYKNEILRKTIIFLGVSHDGSRGTLSLKKKKEGKIQEADLFWPGYINQENIQNLRKDMKNLVEKMNGIFLEYTDVGTRRPLSVHPLGGCRMSSDIQTGAVNHRCLLFFPDKTDSSRVYEGLYVMDGSVIPRSLGINPLWTICAVTERAMTFIPFKEDRRSIIMNNVLNNDKKKGLKFAEFFQGYAFSNFERSHEWNCEKGKEIGAAGVFNIFLDLEISDMEEFCTTRQADRIYGFVESPLLSLSGKLRILQGSHFQFKEEKDNEYNKYFEYSFLLVTEEGIKYNLSGRKELSLKNILESWKETTEMKFEVTDEDGKLKAIGMAFISLESFIRNNLGTMQSVKAESAFDSLTIKGSFIKYFISQFLDVYSPDRLLRSEKELIPDYRPEKPRVILNNTDSGIKEHIIKTEDGLLLKLTHFSQNRTHSKGSVLILHGLTSSSEMFSMPEHHNLRDFLLQNGYDVWLYDFRMSCKFPYNQIQHDYSFEHTALYDIPPAISLIRNTIPEKEKLHIICHCLGSVSFFHSLAGGLVSGVDSIITNSVSVFCRLPPIAVWKLELLVNSRLLEDWARVPCIEPASMRKNDWLLKLISHGNSLFHRECDSSVCHMLSFMWGTDSSALFEHKNMSKTTHDRLEELFGPTTLNYYRHVLKTARAGRLVKYYEDDKEFSMLPKDCWKGLSENRIPILFVTGEKNKIFWDSNIAAYKYMSSINSVKHRLKVYSGYGHQDIFMGKNVSKDIFPDFLNFLSDI